MRKLKLKTKRKMVATMLCELAGLDTDISLTPYGVSLALNSKITEEDAKRILNELVDFGFVSRHYNDYKMTPLKEEENLPPFYV